MGLFSELLIGKGGVNQKGFNIFFLGKNRLRNRDNDAVPDFLDCSPRNYWKDSPIIPVQLQAPSIPQTLAEYQATKMPQTTQQTGLTQEQVSNIEQKQQELKGLNYDEYFSKYNFLPDYMKEFFTSPSELKQTSEYQSYVQQKQTYESAMQEYSDWQAGYARGSYGGIVAGKVSGAFMEGFRSASLERSGQLAENRYAAAVKTSQPFAGPVQQGFNEKVFRETGKSVPEFQGPVQQGFNEKVFRETGKSITNFGFIVPPKDNYTYDASSGFYSTVSPTGRQGTAYIRPPTVSEQQRINQVKQRESGFYSALSTARERYLPTANESSNSVWQSIASFGEMTKEEMGKLGTQISESAVPSLQQRRLMEENLSAEGQQIDLMVQDFQNRYQNASQMQEGSPERQMYESELQNINQMIEQHNQWLQNYTATIEQAQQEPIATFDGFQLFKGGAEFGRSFVKGAVEFPFTIGGMAIGLATDPVQELIGFGRGIKQLPGQIIQYPASTLGYLTGQYAMGGLISKGLKKIREPTFSTEVVGVSRMTEEGVITDLLFKTREEKLGGLFKKDYYGTATGISNVIDEGGIQVSKTITGGVYSPIKYNLFGEEIAAKPKKFGAGSISLSQEAPIEFTDISGVTYTIKGLKGFTNIDVGAIANAEGGSYYAGVGRGIGVEGGTITSVGGVTGLVEKGKVLKGGRGSYSGFVIQRMEEPSLGDFFFNKMGGGKSSQTYLNELYKNTISSATASVIKEISKPSRIVKGTTTGFISASLIEGNYPTYIGGTATSQGTELVDFFGTGNQPTYTEETTTRTPFGITGNVVGNIFGYNIKSNVRTTPVVVSFEGVKVKEKELPLFKEMTITKEKPIQPTFTTLINPVVLGERQNQLFSQAQIPRQAQQQKQILVPRQIQTPISPTIPITRFGFGFDLFTGGENKRTEQAWFGFVKTGNKWEKATGLSTKRGAVDLVSRKVDLGLSRQWKVLPATKEIKGRKEFVEVERTQLYQGDNYYSQNKHKFRTFQQKRGVRTQLPSGAIEKAKYSMDYETPKFKQARVEARTSNLLFGGSKRNKKNGGLFRL